MTRSLAHATRVALSVALASSLACSEGAGDDAVAGQTVHMVQTSRAGDKLTDKGELTLGKGEGSGTVITLSPDKQRQEILGFGGALTESSASVLATLPKDKRQEILDAYFSPEGAGYTLARTHIASCDFSVASYQYSEMADPALSDFSIEHDKELLLPLLKDATTASKGALKIVSAPWSAPAWMKLPAVLYIKPSAENAYVGTDPRLDPQYFAAYALYLSKYIKAYQAEGVKIWGLSPQNEPMGNGGNWETMRWDVASMRTFIGEHLGPQLEKDKLDVKLMVFDHNKGGAQKEAVRWIEYLYADKNAAKYMWGSALHWYGSTVNVFESDLDAIHELAPEKPLLATEATIDGLTDQKGAPPSAAYKNSWLKDEFYWTKTGYDWGYWWATGTARAQHPVYEPVYRYARDIIGGLNHWYAGWIDWNAVLDSTGGPNHENNLCAAPVMVDTKTKQITYSPLFYVMSHFSKYIRPGAHIIGSKVKLAEGVSLEGYDGKPTDGLMATAAKNPDGSYAIVLFNQTAKPIEYDVVLEGVHAEGSIDAQALQTLVWTQEK
jgi:glucosylceramidase